MMPTVPMVDQPITRSTPVLFTEPITSFSDTGHQVALYKIGALNHYTYAYTTATIQDRFNRLANQWEADTLSFSNTDMICSNRAYQQIIGMGDKVLPYIFKRLSQKPDHWFWALSAITGIDPIPHEYQGNVRATTALWLDWGKKSGYFYS